MTSTTQISNMISLLGTLHLYSVLDKSSRLHIMYTDQIRNHDLICQDLKDKCLNYSPYVPVTNRF